MIDNLDFQFHPVSHILTSLLSNFIFMLVSLKKKKEKKKKVIVTHGLKKRVVYNITYLNILKVIIIFEWNL